jgi:8-oxo-dGTP pyrophosphatase MutT (NUDIX family)
MGKLPSMARNQLAVIPFIMHQGQPLILMVTSRETRRWIVPKGWQEKKVTDRDQAGREAFEEAGVAGILSDKPIGSYRYDKRLKDGRVKVLEVAVYSLEVTELLDDWPEMDERERRWMTPAQAAMAVREGALAALLLSMAVSPPAASGRESGNPAALLPAHMVHRENRPRS